MRALVSCYKALSGCPFKSYESQKIQSSQRFMCHFFIFFFKIVFDCLFFGFYCLFFLHFLMFFFGGIFPSFFDCVWHHTDPDIAFACNECSRSFGSAFFPCLWRESVLQTLWAAGCTKCRQSSTGSVVINAMLSRRFCLKATVKYNKATRADLTRLERIGRYLLPTPRAALGVPSHCTMQRAP